MNALCKRNNGIHSRILVTAGFAFLALFGGPPAAPLQAQIPVPAGKDGAARLAIKQGEIRLDGSLRSIDLERRALVVAVNSFTVPGGRTSRLPAARAKEILFSTDSQVFSDDAMSRTQWADLKPGMAVAAIGRDSGASRPLMARQIWTKQVFEDLAQARERFPTKLVVPATKPGKGLDASPPYRVVRYPSNAGALVAYLSPQPGDGLKRPAVLWAHGGFGGIGPSSLAQAKAFQDAGFIVMCPAWRSESDNPGRFELFFGEVDDAVAALKYLAQVPYVDASRLYMVGHSTGGTMTLLAAESTTLLRASFSFGGAPDLKSVLEDGQGYGNTPFDPKSPIEAELRSAIEWTSFIRTPTFYFEGEKSFYVPDARRMQVIARRQGVPFVAHIVKGGNHFDILEPLCRLIAEKIRTDNGPTCNITITEDEVAAAFANRTATRKQG